MTHEMTITLHQMRAIAAGFVRLMRNGIIGMKSDKTTLPKIGQNQPKTRQLNWGAPTFSKDASHTKVEQLMVSTHAIFVKFAICSMTSSRDPLVGG